MPGRKQLYEDFLNPAKTAQSMLDFMRGYKARSDECQIVLEKLNKQLEAKNPDTAKILISHCLEKLKKGQALCDIK